jgi:hypothetical protein
MTDNKKKIIIIGAGWYGLYSAILLQNKYDVIILEQHPDMFNNSSYFNQNRLHLGYHYPRNASTRNICVDGYNKFINIFPEMVDTINKNYYIISKDSIIDYESYLSIINSSNHHKIIKNDIFTNIDGDIINTSEKVINSDKAYKYFKERINPIMIKYNYKVENISTNNNKVLINEDVEGDYILDCTYNQLGLDTSSYIYELTISLVYNKKSTCEFDALTCMDGHFFSIYPRNLENNTYTLTHVKYTPLLQSSNPMDIEKYVVNEDIVLETINNMEKDVLLYYKEFKDNFTYDSYFTSYKCKKISGSDSRDISIKHNDNIISVNCGKIVGIFALEKYLTDYFSI